MADMVDRRGYPRVSVALPLTCRTLAGGPSLSGETLDVSANGLLFESEEARGLAAGARISVLIAVPSGFYALGRTRVLSGAGTVVRAAAPGGDKATPAKVRIAVKFDFPLRFES